MVSIVLSGTAKPFRFVSFFSVSAYPAGICEIFATLHNITPQGQAFIKFLAWYGQFGRIYAIIPSDGAVKSLISDGAVKSSRSRLAQFRRMQRT
ncbi:MAG: hypothetical protein K9K81_08230 [Desulfobacteraceae bacterium]|nr:hypothetical protein [Desulfobacteraceae bacterium]